MLAANEKVFSRFMITPSRNGATGAKAIASAGVGAFIGFACPEFMRHDYLLGRRNCQAFLRREFVLAEKNPIFGSEWSAEMKKKYASEAGKGMQPVIPLMSEVEQKPDRWPAGCLDPAAGQGHAARSLLHRLHAAFTG